jgi:spermidine/putrescine transport system substrate-binding protein
MKGIFTMATTLDRRRFGQLIGTGLATAALAGISSRRAAAATTTITVLNWKGYGTDEPFALKHFADTTGVQVQHDYFSSEPEMLTKLQTNPGAYDVVLIDTARTQQAQASGLIDPIDFSAIPNSKDLLPALKMHPNLLVDGKPYGLSWLWGMNSLVVRDGKVANADSFSIFLDPTYKGRLALFDDAPTEVGIGALLTGQDINNPKDMDAIKAKLKAMKPNVKLLWSSEDEWDKAFAADAFDISVFWSGSAITAKTTHKLPADFIVPKEGAIGWLDGLSLPTGSKNRAAALQFINYMIDPTFYVTWAATGAPASANEVAMQQLPAGNLAHEVYKPEYLSKLQFMSAMPDDRRQAFSDLWEEVKAFYAA